MTNRKVSCIIYGYSREAIANRRQQVTVIVTDFPAEASNDKCCMYTMGEDKASGRSRGFEDTLDILAQKLSLIHSAWLETTLAEFFYFGHG